ncbi:MAG: FAD-dependent oxidoreductase [Pseudomonadota bacterium]
MTSIAIIGAGLAGSTLAKCLSDRADVTVFEKSRGIGGRMATRYAGIYEFDHGAQYFTAQTTEFQTTLKPLIADGDVVEWTGRVVSLSAGNDAVELKRDDPIYVASPRMNVLPKHFAEGLNIVVRCQISSMSKDARGKWRLTDNEGGEHGPYDWVVSATPSIQTSQLLPHDVSFSEFLSQVRMSGCFSVLLGFADRPDVDWQGAKVENSPIGWVAMNSDKPGRETSPSVLVQTTNDWAEANLENDPDTVRQTLMDELKAVAGIDKSAAKYASMHRWRYAHTPVPLGQDYLIDEAAGLAACGDWCLGGRVEHAFTSGSSLAKAIPI